MKTYNKLIRIKYNNKLFDVFCDVSHKKVFLEVKNINGVDKYFYIDIKDYIYLNKIYNSSSDILYNEDKKVKFKYKTYIATAMVLTTIGAVNIYNGNVANFCLDTGFVASSLKNFTDEDEVIDNKELDDFYSKVNFDDVRKTLENNRSITGECRDYCNLFIDALERNLPLIDLRVFNEHLKTLQIIVIPNEEWKLGDNVTGQYDSVENTIEINESRLSLHVLSHELIHCLRTGILHTKGTNLNIDFRYKRYGAALNEAFTEMTAHYLDSDVGDDFFNSVSFNHSTYREYANPLFQIMKLIKDEYNLYDFFNNDIGKLEDVLKKYDLERIIDLYDVYYYSLKNDRINIFEDRLMDEESKLLMLRLEEEFKNKTSYYDIQKLILSFVNGVSQDVLDYISSNVKSNDKWELCMVKKARDYEYNEMSISVPNIKIIYDGNVLYDGDFWQVDEYNVESTFYLISTIGDNGVEFKLGQVFNDDYIDVVTNKKIDVVLSQVALNAFFDIRYDTDINLNNFLKSDKLKTYFPDDSKVINVLIDLKNQGVSDYEFYEKAKEISKDWLYYSNLILKENSSFDYRFISQASNIKHEYITKLENGEEVIQIDEYSNPKFTIYSNNEVIYNDYLYKIDNSEIKCLNVYISAVLNNGQLEYKMTTFKASNYIDILTNEIVDPIESITLVDVLESNLYNSKINLDTFLTSDLVKLKTQWINEKLELNNLVNNDKSR